MLTNLNILFQRLRDAEYAHLLLEQLPVYGLLFGLLFFAVGLYLREDKCRIVALAVILLACGSAVYGAELRQKAMPRILQGCEITQAPFIKEQTKLRQDTMWVYYTTAGLAVLALVSGGKLGTWLNILLMAGCAMAFTFSLWLHMKEAEVFHRNIKKSVPRAKVT
ncbi:hypothetical protein DES53_101221 [Roseimicrobium gellanilyticum]|uniref:Uncharacterized protein n=1 Tax=Roseimicrobium gellanilyticum TaxID=748857 RepID=A0A366HV59_9BACT|nr:hypothetical protein [Roseimicrobium gellanilyticum]RBP47424.1 hypothetical protein DES53_101221 [Roseimicrobium gellanilyticum]